MDSTWSPEFSDEGFDTRRFRYEKLPIFAGFEVEPSYDDSLAFTLSELGPYQGRVVSFQRDEGYMGEDCLNLELYSRNSKQYPFFPGKPCKLLPLSPRPYIDGSLGRFDHSRIPQYYNDSKPYLAFVLRSELGQMDSDAPENAPLLQTWKSAAYPHYEEGEMTRKYWSALVARIRALLREADKISTCKNCSSWPGFIASQPKCPARCEWDQLPVSTTFDYFVSQAYELQIWIRELAAWIRMGGILRVSPLRSGSKVKDAENLSANDDLVGIWINGMTEDKVTWLWNKGRVPLFVVHRIRGDKDRPFNSNDPRWKRNPKELTPFHNNPLSAQWKILAEKSHISCSFDPFDLGLLPQYLIHSDPVLSWKSSSKANENNFPGPNWPEQSARTTLFPNELHNLELRKLHPNHVAWIAPPRVIRARQGIRWEKFIEDYDDNGPLMKKLPRKTHDENEEGFSYYDRKLCRELIFSEQLPLPDGLTHDVNVFGLPAPELPYWRNQECTIKDKASLWVYHQREPKSEDIGRLASEPDPKMLPKLPLEELPSADPTLEDNLMESEETPPSIKGTVRQREATPADPYEMLIFEDSPYLEPSVNTVDPDVEITDMTLSSKNEAPSKSPTQNLAVQESSMREDEEKDERMEEGEDKRIDEEGQGDAEVVDPTEMDPPSVNNPFAEFWELDFKNPTPPPPAPCSLLRFTGMGNVSLDDFRAFLFRTLLWMKAVKEVTIARIVRMVINHEVQFWVKVYDQEQAGWVVRAYRRMTTERGEQLRIGLVSLREWRETVNILGETQWGLPTPLHPHISSSGNSEGPPPRKRRALEDRLQNQPTSLIDRLGETSNSSGSNRQRRNKGRGGTRKKWFIIQHGPLHGEDPIGWETWDGHQWFQNYEDTNS
ncbi:hypothetical protein VKT23_019513 [Stygiomarasmius scandens]|uniref:Uncharacterized protein n=1 Tax=Marasmiellus scandens TaxID=2682957 RepID=A0ABR1IL37_9AGAR